MALVVHLLHGSLQHPFGFFHLLSKHCAVLGRQLQLGALVGEAKRQQQFFATDNADDVLLQIELASGAPEKG
jgi:hypothetical protein